MVYGAISGSGCQKPCPSGLYSADEPEKPRITTLFYFAPMPPLTLAERYGQTRGMRTMWKILASAGVGILSWLLSDSQENITHPINMSSLEVKYTGTSTSLTSTRTRILVSNQVSPRGYVQISIEQVHGMLAGFTSFNSPVAKQLRQKTYHKQRQPYNRYL